MRALILLLLFSALLFSCKEKKYDTIIRDGIIYDGNGGDPYKADIAISGVHYRIYW